MVEVLVAVAVLSLTATASLKLAAMAQRTLALTRERDAMLRDAVVLQTEIRVGGLPTFGKSGDLSWNVTEKTHEGFDEDFGRLDFDEAKEREIHVSWRELEVKKGERDEMVLILPPAGGKAAGKNLSEGAVKSGDKR